MKSVPTLPSIALLGLCIGACGGSGGGSGSAPRPTSSSAAVRTVSSAAPPGGYLRGDGDVDDGPDHRDEDNYSLRHYGHAAGTAQRRAIAALVRRYYTAGAAGNGAAACALIYSGLAGSPGLGEAAEAVYPVAPSVPPLRGQSCARIMSLLFAEDHRRLAADRASVVVTGVRVKGGRGWVLLGFRTTPERLFPLRRERGAWKLEALLDREML